MKTLAALTTALVLMAPTFAVACPMHQDHAQMSCAEGTVYDSATRSCVQPTG